MTKKKTALPTSARRILSSKNKHMHIYMGGFYSATMLRLCNRIINLSGDYLPIYTPEATTMAVTLPEQLPLPRGHAV
jgi:hypothetical protein